MRQFKITLIITIAVIAFILIGIMIYYLATVNIGNGNSFLGGGVTFSGRTELKQIQAVDITNLKKVVIDYTGASGDIYFYESENDELVVKEYADVAYKDFAEANITNNGEELNILGSKNQVRIFLFGIRSGLGYVEIYLPKNYNKEIEIRSSRGNITSDFPLYGADSFFIHLSSGDIQLSEIVAKEIKIETTSGNIDVAYAEGNRYFSVSSGDIQILGGMGDTKIRATSGCINIKDAYGQFDIHTSSGDIEVENSRGGGEISVTSGVISLSLDEIISDIELEASSGDIDLKLPTETSFNFNASTLSGDIKTFFDEELSYNKRGNEANGIFGDNPGISIIANAKSGNVTVRSGK